MLKFFLNFLMPIQYKKNTKVHKSEWKWNLEFILVKYGNKEGNFHKYHFLYILTNFESAKFHESA